MTKKEIFYTAVGIISILGLMAIWFAGYFDGTIIDGILSAAFPAFIISLGLVGAEMVIYEILLDGEELNKIILFLVAFAAASCLVNAINTEITTKIIGAILIASVIALVWICVYMFRNR